jgi:hypothetical protein
MTRWVEKSEIIQYADGNRMSQNDLDVELRLECRYSDNSPNMADLHVTGQNYDGILCKIKRRSHNRRRNLSQIGN